MSSPQSSSSLSFAGLVALRAQSSRLALDSNSARASQLPPAGERWFDKVPDREPSAPPPSADTPPAVPAPALHPSTPAPTRTLSDAELELQRRDRARRAAMAAVGFEARAVTARGSGPERSTTGVRDHSDDRGPGGSSGPAARRRVPLRCRQSARRFSPRLSADA